MSGAGRTYSAVGILGEAKLPGLPAVVSPQGDTLSCEAWGHNRVPTRTIGS